MGKHRKAGLLAVVTAGLFVAAIAAISMMHPLDVHSHLAGLADPHGLSIASLAMLAPLRDKRVALVDKMKEMLALTEAENRDLTAEEQASFDAMKAEKEGLDRRIARIEDLSASTAALTETVPAVARRQGIERAQGPEAAREFESFGEFMHAVRFRPNDQRLNYVENASANAGELSAEQRMDTETSGGFMVPTQLRSTIMKVDPQGALVRPNANVIPAGSPPDAGITIPALDQTGAAPSNVFGGVEVKWIGEGDEKPETDADLRQITLTPHEVAGFVTLTDKLLRNWQASGAFVENLLRSAVTQAEDYAFLRGSGGAQPLGVLNAGATKYVNRTTANRVTYDDLVAMAAVLLMRGGSPVWSMSQSVFPQIAKLQDPLGNYIWHENARDGFAGSLLGYPVKWNNRAPALGVKGDVLLADFSHYLIKDGSGPFVAASEHVKFTSNKTVIKIFWNVDGAPWLTAPFTEENGYQVSPFVGLDVPGA